MRQLLMVFFALLWVQRAFAQPVALPLQIFNASAGINSAARVLDNDPLSAWETLPVATADRCTDPPQQEELTLSLPAFADISRIEITYLQQCGCQSYDTSLLRVQVFYSQSPRGPFTLWGEFAHSNVLSAKVLTRPAFMARYIRIVVPVCPAAWNRASLHMVQAWGYPLGSSGCPAMARVSAIPAAYTVQTSWTPFPPAKGYQLRYRPAGGAWDVLDLPPAQTNKFLSGLLPGTSYEIQCRSSCGISYGPWSVVTVFRTHPAPLCPQAPEVVLRSPAYGELIVQGARESGQSAPLEVSGEIRGVSSDCVQRVDYFLNGVQVGYSPGSGRSFSYTCSERLSPGLYHLAVRVIYGPAADYVTAATSFELRSEKPVSDKWDPYAGEGEAFTHLPIPPVRSSVSLAEMTGVTDNKSWDTDVYGNFSTKDSINNELPCNPFALMSSHVRNFHQMSDDYAPAPTLSAAFPPDGIPNLMPWGDPAMNEHKARYGNWDLHFGDGAGKAIHASLMNFSFDPAYAFPNGWWTEQDWNAGLGPYTKAYNYAYRFAEVFCPKQGNCLVDVLEIGNEPWAYVDTTLYPTILRGMTEGILAYYGNGPVRMRILPAAFQAYRRDRPKLTPNAGNGNSWRNFIGNKIPPTHAAFLDGINLHPYSFSTATAPGDIQWTFPESEQGEFLHIRNAVRWRNANMPGKRIYVSEIGWDADTTGSIAGMGQRGQAVYAVRAALMSQRYGVHRMSVYNSTEIPTGGIFNTCGLYPFGKTNYSGSQNPALGYNNALDSSAYCFSNPCGFRADPHPPRQLYHALKEMTATLGDAFFISVVREDTGLFAYVLGERNGRPRWLLVWQPRPVRNDSTDYGPGTAFRAELLYPGLYLDPQRELFWVDGKYPPTGPDSLVCSRLSDNRNTMQGVYAQPYNLPMPSLNGAEVLGLATPVPLAIPVICNDPACRGGDKDVQAKQALYPEPPPCVRVQGVQEQPGQLILRRLPGAGSAESISLSVCNIKGVQIWKGALEGQAEQRLQVSPGIYIVRSYAAACGWHSQKLVVMP